MDIGKQAQQVINIQQLKEIVQNNKQVIPLIMGYMKNMYSEAVKSGFDKKQAFELVKIYWQNISANL